MELIWTKFLVWLEAMTPRLIGAGVVLILGWWLSVLAKRLMTRAMKRSQVDLGVVTFIGSLVKVLLIIVV